VTDVTTAALLVNEDFDQILYAYCYFIFNFLCFVFMQYNKAVINYLLHCGFVAGHHTKFPAYERVILRERKLLPFFLKENILHFHKNISAFYLI